MSDYLSTKNQQYYQSQIDVLEKHKLIYISILLTYIYGEEKKKFTKSMPDTRVQRQRGEYIDWELSLPKYGDDIVLKTRPFNFSKHTGVAVMMGEKYGGKILIDTDNVDNTIDIWNDLLLENGLCDTLQSKTVSKGMHYYFQCTEEQRKAFVGIDFKASNQKLFNSVIDVKYTNQISYECSCIEKNGEIFKYEFLEDFDEILPLPDWIYEEILRVKGSPKKQEKQIKNVSSSCCSSLHEHVHRSGESIDRESDITQESESEFNNEIRENKDWEILVEFFDRCYKPYRYENYDDLLHVGMAIKNRFGEKGFELWVYFSNKASVHDSEDELRRKYETFNQHYAKPVKIYTLFHFAKEDNEN